MIHLYVCSLSGFFLSYFVISQDGIDLVVQGGGPNFGSQYRMLINPASGSVGFRMHSNLVYASLVTLEIYDNTAGKQIYFREGFLNDAHYDHTFCVPNGHCIEITLTGDAVEFQYFANGQYLKVSLDPFVTRIPVNC